MIDWSAVEVGDVVELEGGKKWPIPSFRPGGPIPIEDGMIYVGGDWRMLDEVKAIHKPGTVGALSHEERSRLWDKTGEHLISVYYAKPNLVEAFTDGSHATGETPLEAVAKCVAAIEQQQACERHARGECDG